MIDEEVGMSGCYQGRLVKWKSEPTSEAALSDWIKVKTGILLISVFYENGFPEGPKSY